MFDLKGQMLSICIDILMSNWSFRSLFSEIWENGDYYNTSRKKSFNQCKIDIWASRNDMFVWCRSLSKMELFFSFYIKTQFLPRCQSIHTPLFSLPQHILFFKFESFLTKMTWWGLDLQASPRTNLLFFIMTEAFEFVLVQFL